VGSLTVLDRGLFTTIQDKGRVGYRKFGIPVSGVMDEVSFLSANKLVGNPENTPVLECTLKGGKYRFESNTVITITGALMSPKINGSTVEMNTSIKVEQGDVLELGFAQKGCRAYVAIKGNWDIETVLGSYSTYTRASFGGFEGRALRKGDEIRWQDSESDFRAQSLPKGEIPYFSSKISVDFIPGPEWDWLNKKEQEIFLSSSFVVDSKSNRMGIRLSSDVQLSTEKQEMSSSGVIPGIIQLPPSGDPIILMNDAQTVGGYPRIGKVLDRYLDRLAQIPPNGIVRFKKSEGF